jgi:diadenosine tetraphosphatase ApaH/serine/threonine PP2A family protein phosphatase
VCGRRDRVQSLARRVRRTHPRDLFGGGAGQPRPHRPDPGTLQREPDGLRGQLAWLDDLPRECVIDGRFLLVHDHPRVRDRYVYPQEFSAIAESVDYDAVILGHTHVQGAETADGTLVVNPGSIGQPRDRDPRAAFAVLDTETVEVDLHRVEYDVERVREAITNAGIPERTGERLLTGG